MARERWGTYSVIDHKDPVGLIPEVLIYDRLVIPVPATPTDQRDWEENGWEPELLFERLRNLGSLAVPATWGVAEHEKWAQQFEAAKDDVADLVAEANEKLGLQVTRQVLAQQQPRILAQQQRIDLPSDIEGVDLVTACQTEADLRMHFDIREQWDIDRADLGFQLVKAPEQNSLTEAAG